MINNRMVGVLQAPGTFEAGSNMWDYSIALWHDKSPYMQDSIWDGF